MPTHLSVNLNAIALLRNRRDLPWPSVVGLGRIALEAGAHGLTVHPRPDERHIRRSDVTDISRLIVAEFPKRELNIEGYPDERFFDIVAEAEPDQATLVPDDPGQATSDHGWDVAENRELLRHAINRLRGLGVRVSLFIDAEPAPARAAAEIGADRVELYTGPYGAAHDDPPRAERELARLAEAAAAAREATLGVNAGHDLTVANLPALVARIPFIAEVSIGHGITADALTYGMAESVRRYLATAGNESKA
jgi:pyridoxine 5-phosphate synthase